MSGGRLSDRELAAYAYRAGFRGDKLTTAVAVALAESGGKPGNVGDVGLETGYWGPSVGLWQIRSVNAQRGTGGQRDAKANLDPGNNARHAYQISGHGTNWRPWSTFLNGAYRQYLPRARAAAAVASSAHGHPSGHSNGSGSTTGSRAGSRAGRVVFDLAELGRLQLLCDDSRSRVDQARRAVTDVRAELNAGRLLTADPGRARVLDALFDQLTGPYGLPMAARHLDFDAQLLSRIRRLAADADGADGTYQHADLVRFLRRAGKNARLLPETAVIEALRAGGLRHGRARTGAAKHPGSTTPARHGLPPKHQEKTGDIVPASLARYRNGRVPSGQLTSIGDGQRLWTGAARQYRRMAQAARLAGVDLHANSGYRTYQQQQHLYELYREGRGNLAATPGHSNHGWGLSTDINTVGANSNALPWLRANASRFGFFNDVPGEPWHWTYRPA